MLYRNRLNARLIKQAITAKDLCSPVTFYRVFQGYRMKGYSFNASYLAEKNYCTGWIM